jgi:hypothetical protein
MKELIEVMYSIATQLNRIADALENKKEEYSWV